LSFISVVGNAQIAYPNWNFFNNKFAFYQTCNARRMTRMMTRRRTSKRFPKTRTMRPAFWIRANAFTHLPKPWMACSIPKTLRRRSTSRPSKLQVGVSGQRPFYFGSFSERNE